MVQRTLPIATPAHHQSQVDQSSERHEGTLGMVGDPEPLSTVHTLLTQRRQAHFSPCRGTRLSSGHRLAPPCGNYSATFLRKKFRSSLSVESTSSTVSADTRPVAPIH